MKRSPSQKKHSEKQIGGNHSEKNAKNDVMCVTLF